MTGPEPTPRTGRFGVAALLEGLLAALLIVHGTLNLARGDTLAGLAGIVGGAGFALAALGAFRREARWRVTAIACWVAAIGLVVLSLAMR